LTDSSLEVVALDCEGVELSREGSICLVQIATSDTCFLLDFKNIGENFGTIKLLVKEVLENKNICKIIPNTTREEKN
jgi:ribonuclease D